MNHLVYQLEYLRTIYLEMLELVKSQFQKSVYALLNHDIDLAEEIIRLEQRVNAYELNIEKECENIIALFQPVATDLRYILAIFKSISDLERIGDHAEFVAKAILERPDGFDIDMINKFSLKEMFNIVIEMYDDIVNAFEHKESESARKVFKKDKEINRLYKQSVIEMKLELANLNPKSPDILHIYAINARLERTGDLITNIAEEIIFYIDAEVLKHNKKKKDIKIS